MSMAMRAEYAGVVAPPVRRAFEALTKRIAKLSERTTTLESKVVIGGSTVDTTDASGYVTIPFGTTFAATPMVVVSNGDPNLAHIPTGGGTSATDATVRVFDFAGAPLASSATRVNWIAVGTV